MVIHVVAVSFNSSLKAEATPQMIHPHGEGSRAAWNTGRSLQKQKTRLASLPSILQRTETGKYWWMTCLKSSFTQTYSSIATGGLLLAKQPQQGHPQLRARRGHKSSDPFALGPHKTQTTYISHITTVENMIRERNTAVLALSCSLDTQFTYWLETGCF